MKNISKPTKRGDSYGYNTHSSFLTLTTSSLTFIITKAHIKESLGELLFLLFPNRTKRVLRNQYYKTRLVESVTINGR